MKKWLWDNFIKKWFRNEIGSDRKTQNQRNYVKNMLDEGKRS
tara:strand:- start:246 stop:371 length:126 start_codon:yes stop_codon:yes gene_type:complete